MTQNNFEIPQADSRPGRKECGAGACLVWSIYGRHDASHRHVEQKESRQMK